MAARLSRRWTYALVGLLTLALLVGGGVLIYQATRPKPVLPAPTIPVALHADLGKDLTVGLVATGGSSGDGTEWLAASSGALVAQDRFQLGGAHVTVVTMNDKGSAEGAAEAVNKLIAQGVSAIILTSYGDYLDAAIEACKMHQVPVLMPYASTSAQLTDGVWAVGPTSDQLLAALPAVLSAEKLSHPAIVSSTPTIPAGVKGATTVVRIPGDDPAVFAKAVAAVLAKKSVDSFVVTGDVKQQAESVAALQQLRVQLPMIVSTAAQNPEFAKDLQAADGTPSMQLVGVGDNRSDTVALLPDVQGRSMSAFLAAVRLRADNADARNTLGDDSFTTVGWASDVRAHDAVIAVVRAAEQARSTEPAEVLKALRTLRVGAEEGVAGSPLDFSTPHAVPATGITRLHSGQDDLGLRPVAPDEQAREIVWFVPGQD